jgi:hypothetical protein
MTPQRQQDIKCVASRIARILKENENLNYNNFKSGLDTLLKLILEEERDE